MAQTGNVYTTHTLCGLLATLEVKLPPGPYQPWNAGGTDDASNLAWRSHRCRSSVTAKHHGGWPPTSGLAKLFTKGRLTGWVHTR